MPITGSQKAPLYAQFGTMRFGATRFGYHSAHLFLSIAGVQVAVGYTGAGRVLIDSLRITDILNDTPNTCTFTVMGVTPAVDDEIVITLGSIDSGRRLFAGHILDVQQIYVGQKPANIQYLVSAVDYTWHLGFKQVTKRYTNQSASAIALDLIQTYAAVNGFTGDHIEAGLPIVDEITFTNEELPTALTRLATRIGGYWKVDYWRDLHAFLTATGTIPTDLTATHPSLSAFANTGAGSQRINRVFFEGGGGVSLAACAVGETIIPVNEPAWYSVNGGLVACGPQRLSYTGKTAAAPGSAPVLMAKAGTGLTAGAATYQYGFTFVSAAGDTVPSPIATVITGPLAPPGTPTVVKSLSAGSLTAGGTYRWKATFSDGSGNETFTSAASAPYVPVGAGESVSVTVINPPQTSGAAFAFIYRTTNGGATYYREGGAVALNYPNPTSSFFGGSPSDASLTANPTEPGANTMVMEQVALSSITVGPNGTTARKIYRTAANGSQLKLQQTIANNTATAGVQDATADGSLGANAPTTDTSLLSITGMTYTNGSTSAGAVAMTVNSAAAFSPTGGWALLGTVVVRYTGTTATTLTGIPTSGKGAITTTIPTETTVEVAPALLGIPASGPGSVLYQILLGDPVNLVVQADDLAAQAALAARLGGDGVIEVSLQDRRMSETESRFRAEATIAQRSSTAESYTYQCRDLNTASGKDITVNLVAPTSVSGVFKIQTVTISNFRPFANQLPTFSVQASAQRYSFEDLLRRAR